MSGKLLTTNSTVQCPHGGTVTLTTSNSKVSADNGFILLMTDVHTISGCPFQIPAPSGTVPSPCMTVQWIVGEFMTLIDNTPVLSESSVGLCLAATGVPQGTASVVNTQSAVSV